jgi:hypothetical protein
VTLLNASAVNAILNEGMMIGVRLGSSISWHGNIVYGLEGSTIRVAYIDKFMKDVSTPGCNASIKYSNDYFVYYFSGIVKGISKEHPEYVTIKITSAEEIINNRLFPRYDVILKAKLKPVWDDEIYNCTITDLSYGGAAFVCTHKFDSNEQIEMSLLLPSGVIAKVIGKVVRKKSTQSADTDHSVQFIECDNLNNKLLSEYFTHLEEEVSDIYRHYVEEIKGTL